MDKRSYDYGFARACWERHVDPRVMRKVAQDAGATTSVPAAGAQITGGIEHAPTRAANWWENIQTSLIDKLSPNLFSQLASRLFGGGSGQGFNPQKYTNAFAPGQPRPKIPLPMPADATLEE